MARHGESPARAAVVDESPADVATAAELGFEAIPFEGASRLRQLGIDVAPDA
jgi:hypothetical protein